MAKLLYNVRAYEATAAEFADDETVYPANALLIATDSGEIKKGNGTDAYADLTSIGGGGGEGGAVAWEDVTGKPATFAPTIGTTAETAKAGNYAPAWGDVTGKPTSFAPAAHAATLVNVAADATNGITAGNAQVVLVALAARIKALEDAAG